MVAPCRCLFGICYAVLFDNDAAGAVLSTLSLHDALPISLQARDATTGRAETLRCFVKVYRNDHGEPTFELLRSLGERSEEHTSELQSRGQLVCRLLLEKKRLGLPSVVSESALLD